MGLGEVALPYLILPFKTGHQLPGQLGCGFRGDRLALPYLVDMSGYESRSTGVLAWEWGWGGRLALPYLVDMSRGAQGAEGALSCLTPRVEISDLKF